jgi:hypothetical protein
MRFTGCVACMAGKRPFGKFRHRKEDNMETCLRNRM